MYSVERLDIPGYRDEPLPNTFFRREGETERLAVIFPGVGYTVQGPLLRSLEALADVVRVERAFLEG